MNCGILRMFPFLESDEECLPFVYDTENAHLKDLVDDYQIRSVAGDGSQLSRAITIMYWLRAYITYNGRTSVQPRYDARSLLEYGFGKPANGLNCRMLATVLAEILLGLGMKSRIVSLHSVTPYDGDNHVVTIVWIEDTAQWVLLDPSFSAFFESESGDPLSPWKLRRRLADEAPVVCHMRARFGTQPRGSEERLLTYMSKNLFYMYSPLRSTFGSETDAVADRKWVYLAPAGFNIKMREFINITWRVRKYGDPSDPETVRFVREQRDRILGGAHLYTSSEKCFSAQPE